MPRLLQPDRQLALDALLARDDLVVSHAELRGLGVPVASATYRCREGGRWQAHLPGVIIAHSGQPTPAQRQRAALKYAGGDAVLTGSAALLRGGVPRVPTPSALRVLVPAERRRQSRPGVVIERTARMPDPVLVRGLACAPVVRALVDECRHTARLDDVRHLVAAAVQSRACRVPDLEAELKACQRRGSGLPRMVLVEVSAGIRSVSEAKQRTVLQKAGLAHLCEFNVSLYTRDGAFIAQPDGWFDAEAVALESDSMEFHLGPAEYKGTQSRQRELAAAGALVVPVAPSLVLASPDEFVHAVQRTLVQGRARPRPDIMVVRRAG